MSSNWSGSVHIAAPVADVYAFLSDFSRHAEWDHSATKLEKVEPGDANGIGAQWRTYERLDTFQADRARKPLLHLHGNVGVTVREVREMVADQRIAWHSYPVPRMGVTSDCSFELTADGDGTRLTETVTINAPSVMETVGKFVFRGLDAKQQAQWESNLQNIKNCVEKKTAALPVGVGV